MNCYTRKLRKPSFLTPDLHLASDCSLEGPYLCSWSHTLTASLLKFHRLEANAERHLWLLPRASCTLQHSSAWCGVSLGPGWSLISVLSSFSLSLCVCCHLSLTASLLPPPKWKSCFSPKVCLLLFLLLLFPPPSVPLFSPFFLLCKLSLSRTDLGFKPRHETWPVFTHTNARFLF